MAEAWHQTADGAQIKVDVTKHRGGDPQQATGLGYSASVVDVFIAATLDSPLAPDGRISISFSPLPGAKEGDGLLVCPTVYNPPETPGNELFGLTIGPCHCTNGGGSIILQNRTTAPIVIPKDFHLRAFCIHVLPQAPVPPAPVP